VRDSVAFEGQAAMELEWLATSVPADGCYPFDFTESVVDTRPLIRAVAADAVRGVAPALIARRFHSTVVEISRTVCRKLRETSGINIVVLTGGVFMNALLVMESTSALEQEAFGVYGNVKVPPNDGGISLGQLAVAASRLSRSR
jgi:hydrogenase maturation protein HypF